MAAALVATATLAACGQKGPLFLPEAQGGGPAPIAHVTGSADDREPRAPLPPLDSASSPGVSSGVVPAR